VRALGQLTLTTQSSLIQAKPILIINVRLNGKDPCYHLIRVCVHVQMWTWKNGSWMKNCTTCPLIAIVQQVGSVNWIWKSNSNRSVKKKKVGIWKKN